MRCLEQLSQSNLPNDAKLIPVSLLDFTNFVNLNIICHTRKSSIKNKHGDADNKNKKNHFLFTAKKGES